METLGPPRNNGDFSSSPAFGTPLVPILPAQARRPPPPPAFSKATVSTILPILLPPPTLRPLAFRTFTKKHNLTLGSSALQALATFVGRHCGSGWRAEGTGEKVLEEVAKLWKAESGPVIVEDGDKLKGIMKTLEGCMTGGRIGPTKSNGTLSRQSSFAFGNVSGLDLPDISRRPSLDNRHSSFGLSKLQVDEEDEREDVGSNPRAWLKIISAFDQPRFSYNVEKKHFDQVKSKPSMFPSPSHKAALFRERYNIIHQRLLRNEAFQTPSFSAKTTSLPKQDSMTAQQFYKITPIANLLGRGGSSHLLLGMLTIAPTGTLALTDPSGSISLDVQHAQSLQGQGSSFFCPGMIVLVDGVYEEDWAGAGSTGLGNTGGVGGTIGGRFIGFSIGGPPVEKRNVSLGMDLNAGDVGGGFGWTDFLGLGSERAVGTRMRILEQRMLGTERLQGDSSGRKMIILSEVTLDQPNTLSALRKVLQHYTAQTEPPMCFVLTGNFTSRAAMAGASTGSIEYKEMFNELAAVLADFPSLLRNSTWVFVPGDNDAWLSAFSAGASTLVPREGVPDIFTSRIKRASANAKSEAESIVKDGIDGEAVWTSNPARLTLFGSAHELMVFRDDVSGRFRRNAIRIGQAAKQNQGNHPELPSQVQEDDTTMSGALPTTDDVTQPNIDVAEAMSIDPPLADSTDDYATNQAKKLILSLLPQSTLSPFPLTTRPVHWDYTSAMSLYPLPHTLILADVEAEPYTVTFEGCHVINPGRLVSGGGRKKTVQWVEYDCWSKRGKVMRDSVG